MKNLKKITAFLCAAALAGGVCAACACGGGEDDSVKPEMPSGLTKVSEDNYSEVAAKFKGLYNSSRNLIIEVYGYNQVKSKYSYSDEGETVNVDNLSETKVFGKMQFAEIGNALYGDCNCTSYTNIPNSWLGYAIKSEVTGTVKLRDDTVSQIVDKGTYTKNEETEDISGLQWYQKGVSDTTFLSTCKQMDFDINLEYLLRDYEKYLHGSEYYLPDTEVAIPRSEVKSYNVSVYESETKIYYTYKRVIDHKTSGASDYFDTEWVVSADCAAGLTENNFDSGEIPAKAVENVLYIDPDVNDIVTKLKAGEDIEFTPIGGGTPAQLEIVLNLSSNTEHKEITATYENGKFVVLAEELSTLNLQEGEWQGSISANYGQSCETDITFKLTAD